MYPNSSLNKLAAMEDKEKAFSILNNAFAIASAGIAALKTMEIVIPAAALTVENASRDLSDHFMTLVENMQDGKTIDREAVLNAINGVTVGMQFQDRNTQIAENAVMMMGQCRTMLEDVQHGIKQILEADSQTQSSVATAVEIILSAIRLSDIKTSFKETLTHMNIDFDDGLPPVAENANNDIELF